MRGLGLAPALLLAGVAAAAAEPRPVADMAAAPWHSLARVVSAGEVRCTGFVVAPDLVVTAGHCVFGARQGRFLPASAVHVQVAYRMGAMAEHRTVVAYRTIEGFDPRNGPAAAGADVAVLHLGKRLSAAPVPVGSAATGAVALGGYARQRPEVLQADGDCRIRGTTRDRAGRTLLVHDCAGGPGTSGAPLLQRGSDQVWRVLGVQVAGHPGRGESYAVPAATWVALLKDVSPGEPASRPQR